MAKRTVVKAPKVVKLPKMFLKKGKSTAPRKAEGRKGGSKKSS